MRRMILGLMLFSLCGCATENLTPEERQERSERIQEFALKIQAASAIIENTSNRIQANSHIQVQAPLMTQCYQQGYFLNCTTR